jgi:hypothetical protein
MLYIKLNALTVFRICGTHGQWALSCTDEVALANVRELSLLKYLDSMYTALGCSRAQEISR